MIERDLHVPPGVDAVRAVGVVTPEDYHDVVTPMLAVAMRERRLRILCTVDEAFAGMTPASSWDDVRLGLTTMRYLAGCGVVSDAPRVREMARFSAFFLAGPVQVFDLARRDDALRWLAGLPGAVAVGLLGTRLRRHHSRPRSLTDRTSPIGPKQGRVVLMAFGERGTSV